MRATLPYWHLATLGFSAALLWSTIGFCITFRGREFRKWWRKHGYSDRSFPSLVFSRFLIPSAYGLTFLFYVQIAAISLGVFAFPRISEAMLEGGLVGFMAGAFVAGVLCYWIDGEVD